MENLKKNLNLKKVDLKRNKYVFVDNFQRDILYKKKNNLETADYIIFSEFNHIITLGRNSKKEHLLVSEKTIKENNIQLYNIDRGGDVTYHGPGQLVIYPIVDLKKRQKDLHKYIRDLEDVIIIFLKKYNIKGSRDSGFTGVWVSDKKIAAIGIGVSGWIAYHGIGLNISTDLECFKWIVPCGIKDKKATSLEQIYHSRKGENLEKIINIDDIKNDFFNCFCEVFNYEKK